VLSNSQTEKLICYGRQELLGRKIETLVPGTVFGESIPATAAGFFAEPRRADGAGLELSGLRKDAVNSP